MLQSCDESKRPLIDTKVRVYKLEVNGTALAALGFSSK